MSLAAPSAGAANAGPAWKLTAISAPTRFAAGETGTNVAGPGYLIEGTNVGGAATTAPVTLQATLPPGVAPSGAIGSAEGLGSPPSCSISGDLVNCTTPGPVQPGRSVAVTIVVDTEPGLSGSVVAEATVSGGAAVPRTASIATTVGTQPPSFGFLPGAGGLASSLTEADGSPAGLAGSHPYQLTVDAGFPSKKATVDLLNSGHPRDVFIDLPPGLIIDPTAVPTRCTEAQLTASTCPPASQIGIVTLTTAVVAGPVSDSRSLYNLVPPPGSASNFGFNAGDAGIPIHLLGSVRGSDYGLSAAIEDLLARFPVFRMRLQLWGDPSSPSHDAARDGSVPPLSRPLLTMPGACGPLATSARADSWEEPGVFVERSTENQDLEGNPVEVSGCNALEFSPRLEARPTTDVADSPSGFDVGLDLPRTEALDTLAAADIRGAEVTLPEGLVANPAAASGLAGCSPALIGLIATTAPPGARFDEAPARCPDAARIGAAEVDTPLLDHPLPASVYLATPGENPFDSLLAIYVVAEDARSGVRLKLAGRIEADPGTGRLTATFDELPQLPISHVALRFFGGATGPLRTPTTCGAYSTTSSLTPWSAPGSGPAATASDSYRIDRTPAGSACVGSEAALPQLSTLAAGTVSPQAGSYTPFVFGLSRDDGSQQFSSLTLTTPPGVVANLAGVSYCPEGGLAAAAVSTGRAERTGPSCPAASRVGSATVAAGAGPAPYYVSGGAYLAGPYRGAPLSLAIVAPAVAGPFDLGNVVLRSALRVDPRTAQLSASSDPIPSIMRGIPLDLRSVRVDLDRARFIRNPTSCDPMRIEAGVASPSVDSSLLSSHFQVGGCGHLGFEPKVSVRLLGPIHRGAHPKLRTVLTARPGDANIRRLAVTLPGTELLDNRHIGAICSRARFAASRCPTGSIYGYAKVWTPLLEQPLEGPVYLRESNARLPDLALSLDGQIHIDLIAGIDSVGGRLRNTFAALPDVPLSKVVLTMRGGSRGLLVNAGGLCAEKRHAGVDLLGQNGKRHGVGSLVRTACR